MSRNRRGARTFIGITFGAALSMAVAAVILAGCGSSGATQSSSTQLLSAGLAAQNAGHTQVALDDYQAVLKQEPGNKYALYDLGLINQQQGNTAAAEAQYRAALVSDPNYVPALFNLAILRTKEAPYEAVDLYRHVIALQPAYAAAHLNLGYVLRSLGQVTEGNAEIARALVLQPSLAATASPSPQSSPAS
jgi:tetratricopeptide (TPR) repeat protein